MQVEIFSDVVCPWCYIGKRRFEEALAAFDHASDVTVTYRSFQLDPHTPDDVSGTQAERLAGKYGMPVEKAEAMNEQVATVAAEAGLEFDFDAAKPANTLKAHALLHYASEHGKQLELTERLLAAHFSRGEHVGDDDMLVAAATEVGLDPDGARAALTDQTYAASVRADINMASAMGVQGVPFFVIDRTYGISGAQPAAVLTQAMDKAWLESHPLTMVNTDAATPTETTGQCADGSCAV